jgi:hypothetical protein
LRDASKVNYSEWKTPVKNKRKKLEDVGSDDEGSMQGKPNKTSSMDKTSPTTKLSTKKQRFLDSTMSIADKASSSEDVAPKNDDQIGNKTLANNKKTTATKKTRADSALTKKATASQSKDAEEKEEQSVVIKKKRSPAKARQKSSESSGIDEPEEQSVVSRKQRSPAKAQQKVKSSGSKDNEDQNIHSIVTSKKRSPAKAQLSSTSITRMSRPESSSQKSMDGKNVSSKGVGAFAAAVESVLTMFDGDKDSQAALKKLQKEYADLWHVRQTQPEKLLEESNRLAKEAYEATKRTHLKMKQEIAILTQKVEKYENREEITPTRDVTDKERFEYVHEHCCNM